MNLESLITNVLKYNQNIDDLAIIRKAYHQAEELHAHQKRASGEDYIIHPLAVANILASIEADTNTIVAALLHDTIEDTDITKEDIAQIYNPHIAMLVDGVTKINKLLFDSKDEAFATNTRKLFNGITEDVRIILIKLADRLHNMQTLEYKNKAKRKETSIETMEIFVPIAYYLGCYEIRRELENLSFKYINPKEYHELSKKILKIQDKYEEDLGEMLNKIHLILEQNNIPHRLKTRVKNIYGIYKKIRSGKKINEIHDLLSLKIIVDEISNCYPVVGHVHSLYPLVQGSFKDYIYQPKENMYQSLHTTFFLKEAECLVQARIRTEQMDRVASKGITVHWSEENDMMNDALRKRFQFFKSLVELNQSNVDNFQFLTDVKTEILSPNIYVYTPQGETIELPEGSTPIDFAYKIHTEVGNNMVGVIVNAHYVPVDTVLKNGAIVKIITNDLEPGPQPEWLMMCKTPLAKRKISDALNRKNLALKLTM